MSRLIWLRPEAERDIEDAARWYEQQKAGLGQQFIDELLQTLASIAERPFLYPIVHRSTCRALTRRFPFGVYFRVEEKSVVVVAVMHGSRHPRRWKGRT